MLNDLTIVAYHFPAGINLGPSDELIESAIAQKDHAFFQAKDCKILEPHHKLQCQTPAGYGSQITWRVSIANQTSSQPKTQAKPPQLFRFTVGVSRPVLLPNDNSCTQSDESTRGSDGTLAGGMEVCSAFSELRPPDLPEPNIGIATSVQSQSSLAVCGHNLNPLCPIVVHEKISVNPMNLSSVGGELMILRGENLGLPVQNCLVPTTTCEDPWSAEGLGIYFGPVSHPRM